MYKIENKIKPKRKFVKDQGLKVDFDQSTSLTLKENKKLKVSDTCQHASPVSEVMDPREKRGPKKRNTLDKNLN